MIRELKAAIAEYGKPRRIRMDNGSEFASREFQAWCSEQKIEVVPIRPGKPVENAYCENFNGRLREEFLNTTQFRNLFDARSRAKTWYKHYNEHRSRSSLDYRTPSEFAAQTLAYEAKELYGLAAT